MSLYTVLWFHSVYLYAVSRFPRASLWEILAEVSGCLNPSCLVRIHVLPRCSDRSSPFEACYTTRISVAGQVLLHSRKYGVLYGGEKLRQNYLHGGMLDYWRRVSFPIG